MTSKKHIVKNLLLAFSPVLLYNALNLIYLIIFSTLNIQNSGSVYFKFDSQFCIIMLILFSIWLYNIYKHHPETQALTRREAHMIIKIPILTLAMNGISSLWFIFISLYLESFPLIANSLESFQDTWSTVGDESYFFVLISVVLAGPIVEELLFRGIMFHYLEKIRPGWFAILISGITFGLWHMEPVQVVYAAIMGILLGFIYAKVRDLKVTIAIHILNNFLSTLPPFMDTTLVQEIIFYVSFLMIPPAIYILVRMVKKDMKAKESGYMES